MIRPVRLPRRLAVVLASALSFQAGAAALLPVTASAQTADPRAALAAGDKAARAKDWTSALAQYEAANKAQPSAEALEGLANARYQMKQDAEAYAAYDEYLTTYGAKVAKPKKATADARLKELEGRTGLLTVTTAEPGATVTVDDKPVGTTPLAKPLRVAAGPHKVRVAKDGFSPVDQAPNVTAGGAATVDVKLEPLSSKGRLAVREKTGKPIRVFVDGVDMGDAPWTGDVEAGAHDVGGRGPSFAAAPEKVQVERGKTRDVELVASATLAPLKITTSDGKGNVYLDGKLVGEGSFAEEVPAGPHKIRVTREGYDPYEEEIVLEERQPRSIGVTLKLASTIETQAVRKEDRALEGIYGGVGLVGTTMIGGTRNSVQRACEREPRVAELAYCSGESGGLGAGLNGFIGYHWDPVGVELFLGGHYDQTSPTMVWSAPPGGGIGVDPARTEEFTIRRVGGHTALRIRLTLQGTRLRFTAATGVGLSYRAMMLERRTTDTANPAVQSGFVPDAESYLSPVLSFEPAVHYRLSDGLSIGGGLSLLLESPSAFKQVPTTAIDNTQRLGPNAINTPPYELAKDAQIYIGPFIGLMFGP